MSDFSFTSTAQCDLCGNHLSSSDEDCDHDGERVETQVFRHFSTGKVITVRAVRSYRWEKLADKFSKWIAFHYIGAESEVNSWEDTDAAPVVQYSVDARKSYEP